MKIDFSGKKIIITGGTRGIGAELCNELEKLGAELIITGTNLQNIDLSKISSQRKYIELDFRKPETFVAFCDLIKDDEKITGLVNNAGINKLNNVSSILDEDVDEMMDVNLKYPLKLVSKVSKIFIKNCYGRIVNISSIFGSISRERRMLYTATKAGIHGITIGTAVELGKYGILTNTVSPGFVETELTRKNLSPNEIKELSDSIPVGRLANPEDICSLIVYLLSDFNTYVNGQNIIVDGGYTKI